MERKVSVRRVLILLAAILVGVPVGLALLGLVALLLWTHGANLADRVRLEAQAVSPADLLPQPPLPGDHAVQTLLAVAEPVHRAYNDQKLWQHNCHMARPAPEPCLAWLASQAASLKTLDEWLAGPEPYKLGRPADLGARGRVPIERYTLDAPIPNVIAVQSLARLLAVRAMKALDEGSGAAAARDERTIFALGDYLTQTPILVSQMVGHAVHRIGLGAILRAAGPRSPLEDFEAALPDLSGGADALRRTFIVEEAVMRNVLDNAGPVLDPSERWQLWLARGLGFYDREVTWRRFQAEHRAQVAHLEDKTLGSAFYRPADAAACGPPPEGVVEKIRAMPNFLGRPFLCDLSWERYTAIYASTVDGVAATRVVLAARRHFRDRGAWPAQESHLVPAYLAAWPVSRLDNQPIPWTADRGGLELLDVDGRRPCSGPTAVPCPARFAPS